MRGRSIAAFCGMLAVTAMTPALMAQAPAFGGHGQAGGRGFGAMRGEFGPPVTGAPYSAVRTTTHVETLANGTTITRTSTDTEARDSEGRTYRATTVERGGKSFTTYRVFDPVGGTITSWTSNSKQANVMQLPDRSQFQGRWAHGRASGAQHAMNFHRNGVAPTVEKLGSNTMDGVVADGTRTTFVIPAGKEGNSQPLTITHESWFSSDLQLEVLRIDSDPRTGTTTTQLSNIVEGEPQAALFHAPAGYSVQVRGRGQQFTPGMP